jgi:hypothetical protein
MTWDPQKIGHGYNDCIIRVEHRPTEKPHTKDELIEILDTLKAAGVEAWWYSVSAKGSYPLFPSKVLPYKKDIAVDYLPWLVEEAHKRDIVIFSWEYLNTSPLLMKEHPDWRVKYLQGPEIVTEEKERHNHFACFNSPYGEQLKDFCVEVVNDIGFDGIWFDGCYQFGPADDGFRWTCCCEYCAKKFKDATGYNIPQVVNWKDPVFHKYIKWRYSVFMDYWKDLSDYVRLKNKTALITYNFFNRHYMGAVSGSPLVHHQMDALIAGEGTTKTVQMQTKTLRAISDKYPPEVWTALHDGVKLSYPSRPNPDPASSVFYAQAAATAGGYASFGIGAPANNTKTLKIMSNALQPLKGNIGGKAVKMCGLLYSGITKDFSYEPTPDATHFASKNKPVVDNTYGIGFMLDALHYPYEIILDNQLDQINDYKVIVLPDVQCMTDLSLEHLVKYVEKGGILVAIGECGINNAEGEVCRRGILDSLFGIKKRYDNWDYCTLEPVVDCLKNNNLPDKYMISGKARLLEVEEDVTILAYGKSLRHKSGISNHDKQTSDNEISRTEKISNVSDFGVAICKRQVGRGEAIYIAPAIGSDYSQNPNKRSREVFKRVLGDIELAYTVEAPANVVVTAWEKEGRLTFHILNQPATMQNMSGFAIALNPEDFAPTGPVSISLSGNFDKVISPYSDLIFNYEKKENHMNIKIPLIKQHAILILS